MAEDRDLEIFSDDLFRYLLPIRIGIKEYCSWLQRTPEDSVSNFHPHIGMSVLCHSFNIQYCFFLNFLENRLEIQKLDSFVKYLTNYTEALYLSDEYNIFEKLLMLASVTLELSVFYYLQGNRELIYYASKFYFYAFRYYYKNDFFTNGGWNAWKDFVSDDVKFCEKAQLEVPDSDTEICIGSEKLRRLDQWIAGLAFKIHSEETSPSADSELHESCDPSDTLSSQETAFHAEDKTQISEITDKTITSAFNAGYKIFKDCSRRKKYINKSKQLILDLKQIIDRNKDYAHEQLSEIIENDICINELMRFCIFPDLIDMLKNSEIKMRNLDILQFIKLILNGNPLMAVYCRYVVQEVHEQLNKAKFSKEEGSERKILDLCATKSNQQEARSGIESAQHLNPVKESISSAYDAHKILLLRFLQELMYNRPYASTAEICRLLLGENAETLLHTDIFRSIMRVTVNNPENRWENVWILSIMQLLINSSQTNEDISTHPSMMNYTQETDFSTNDDFDIDTSQQIIELVPNTVPSSIITKTIQPSVSFNTDHERIATETVCDNDSNAEKDQADAVTPESHYKRNPANSVAEFLQENVTEVFKNIDSETLTEDIVAHSSKLSIEDSETEASSQIVQESFETPSEGTVPHTSHIVKQNMDVPFGEEISYSSEHKSVSITFREINALTSSQEICKFEDLVNKITESREQCFIAVKRVENEGSKEVFTKISIPPSKLNENSERKFDSDLESQVKEASDNCLTNILRVPNIFEFGSIDICYQEATDSFYRNIKKDEAHEKSEYCSKVCVSTDESPDTTINFEKQVTDPVAASLSIKPKSHPMHETYENKVKDETEVGCNTLHGRNFGTDSEIPLLSQGDSDFKQRTKLESDSNTQPGEIILSKETSSCSKDTNLMDNNSVTNQSALASGIICAEDTNLISQEITESKNTSLKFKNLPSEILSIYENALSLLPENTSNDMSNWILEEIIENNVDLLEMMEAKFIMDNQLKKQISKHHNTFKETFKGNKSKSDAENSETDSSNQNLQLINYERYDSF